MTNSQNQSSESTNDSNEIKPEQALGLVSLGLMQKLANKGISSLNWLEEDNEENADLHSLRQRLELTSLAIDTGAPLTTSEITKLLGIKPNSTKFERAGLIATRLSRNVWRLNRAEKNSSYWRN
tara:strand:- start:7 stop:378 length:372 start_codon:yes stop_codon:yes gene_type:complete